MATFLAIWWLRLRVPRVGGLGLIPGQGTKIPHAAQIGEKKKFSVSTYESKNLK